MTSAVANNTVKSKRSLRTVGSEVLVLLCSAFVYSMAFPGFMSADGIWILGFLSLIPVFAVIRRTSWKLVWAYGFMYGFVFYIFFDYWLKSFHPLAILLIPVIKGFEMIFLFIALKATAVFFRKLSPLFQAIVWVAYAYMAESWFAGVPYGNIAYVFYAVHPLVQIADITGVWGIVFLAILPQAYFGKFLAEYLEEGRGLKAYIKAEPFTLILWIALMAFDLVYGAVRLSEWTGKEPDRTWDVVAVQHNHDSWENGYATYLHNFNNLRRMTLESLQATDPDIVIWSETAFVPSVAWYTQYGPDNSLFQQQLDRLVDDFVAFGSGLGVPLLTGNSEGTLADPEQPPVLADGTSNRIDYTSTGGRKARKALCLIPMAFISQRLSVLRIHSDIFQLSLSTKELMSLSTCPMTTGRRRFLQSFSTLQWALSVLSRQESPQSVEPTVVSHVSSRRMAQCMIRWSLSRWAGISTTFLFIPMKAILTHSTCAT